MCMTQFQDLFFGSQSGHLRASKWIQMKITLNTPCRLAVPILQACCLELASDTLQSFHCINQTICSLFYFLGMWSVPNLITTFSSKKVSCTP